MDPAPSCPPMVINGKDYCAPFDATFWFGCGTEPAYPCETRVMFGDSKVVWETDENSHESLVEWDVKTEDEGEFAELREAFADELAALAAD